MPVAALYKLQNWNCTIQVQQIYWTIIFYHKIKTQINDTYINFPSGNVVMLLASYFCFIYPYSRSFVFTIAETMCMFRGV